MKLIRRIIGIIFYLLLVFSCKDNKKINKKDPATYPSNVTIEKSGIVQFELDSLTSNYLACIQFVGKTDSNDVDKLVYFNEETGSLYINDVLSKKIITKIDPEISSDKLRKKFQGFYYYTKDSIFLFSYSSKVLLINSLGKVMRTYTIDIPFGNVEQNRVCRGMDIETKHLPFIYGNKLFINSLIVGNLSRNETRNNQIILNLQDGKVSIGKPFYPEDYHNDYGGLHYYIYYSTGDANSNRIIYSFPASENLTINSLQDDKIYYHLAESKYIESIAEFDESKYTGASAPEAEYFMQNSSYGSILYDKYRNLYYRFALLPVDQKNALYEAKNAPTKQISIIVLDKDFKYLGEQLLKKNGYWPNTAFVSQDGLNIQNKTDGDSTLDFSVFNVAKK